MPKEVTAADLARYEGIKLQIKRLEEEMKPLNEAILAYMEAQGADETPALPEGGKIVRVQKKTYEYSSNVDAIADRLKEAKSAEEADGTAEVVVKPYIKYESAK